MLVNRPFHKILRKGAVKPVLEAGETHRLQITTPAQSFLDICYGVLSQQPQQLPWSPARNKSAEENQATVISPNPRANMHGN